MLFETEGRPPPGGYAASGKPAFTSHSKPALFPLPRRTGRETSRRPALGGLLSAKRSYQPRWSRCGCPSLALRRRGSSASALPPWTTSDSAAVTPAEMTARAGQAAVGAATAVSSTGMIEQAAGGDVGGTRVNRDRSSRRLRLLGPAAPANDRALKDGSLDSAGNLFCCGRAAIVSISASDCRIDAAIHKSLTIAAADAEPRWRSGSGQGA